MTNEIINKLKKYTAGKKNTEKVEISVLALNRIIFALEEQSYEDAISREDALMALTGEWTESRDEILSKAIRRIKALPPVTPQPKTGYWIRVTDKTGHLVWECNRCGWQQKFNTNYCPDCGCRMVESQESVEIMENDVIKTVTNAEEAEAYLISENISKGFEEFTRMVFKQGQAESEG